MHDHIAGIYQHPVGRLQAFHPGRAISRLLDGAQNMIGNRAHMAVGSPAGDQDEVGDGGLSGQIDGDDILCLIIVKNAEDQGFEGFTLPRRPFQADRGGRGIIALTFDRQCRNSR